MAVTSGTNVTLTATPAAGYAFQGWGGACTGTGTCSLSMTSDRSVSAQFVANPPTTYAVNVSVTGSGSVTSSPSGINCPSGSCSMAVTSGTNVTLTATPAAGYAFQGWGGACTGTGTCSLSVTSDRSVSAQFVANPPTTYAVNVSVTGSGSVTSNPSGINCPSGSCSMAVTSGTNVTLTATPAAGYTFQDWGGACTGTGTCSLSMTSDRSISALFVANRTYPCGQQPCVRGQFPPASWRPYADTSPFNTGVPSNAALIPSSYCSAPIPAGSTCSREMVGRLLGDISNNNYPAHWLVAFDGMTGWPTYYGTTNDPTFNVTCNEYLQPGQTNSCPSMPIGKAPGGAVVQGASNPLGGSDRHLTFIDQDTELEFDLWHVQMSPLPYNGGSIPTGYSGYTTITGDGRSLYGDGNAGRFGNLAGRIRIEEMTDAIARKSYINHALTIAVNCTSGQWIYPANGNSGRSCSAIGLANGNAPPMGAHIHLDMTLADIDALTQVPEWKKVLLRTLAVYGAYVNDTGSDFYFSWQLESGIQYSSMGVADPWRAFASSLTNSTGTNDWWDWNDEYGSGYKGLWNTSNGINWETQVWSRLRVLAQ